MATDRADEHEVERLTDDGLTELLERLAPRAGYRLRHVAPPESTAEIDQVDRVNAELLQALYACVLDPSWSDRFVPPSGMDGPGDDVMVDAGQERTVTVGPDFTLKDKQEGSGEPEYSESRRGRACGHVFRNGEGVWHCFDCALDPTCVLCVRCYRSSAHVGHSVHFTVHSSGVGCCDCGDPEAWKDGQLVCALHTPRAQEPDAVATVDPAASPLSDECKATVLQHVRAVTDFVITVLAHAPDVVAPPEDAQAIRALLSRKERAEAAKQAAWRILEEQQANLAATGFGMDTTEGSDPLVLSRSKASIGGAEPPPAVEGPASASRQSAFRSLFTASRKVPDKGKSKSWRVSAGSQPQGARGVRGEGPWTAILWNDEKHSYAQVIQKVSETTGCTHDAALRVAQRVDLRGRDVLAITDDADRLAAIAKSVSSISLGITVQPASDAFVEMALDVCVAFLADLAGCRTYGVPPEDEAFLAQAVYQAFCERLDHPSLGLEQADGQQPTRFEQLLISDSKLWKEPRQKLKSLYVSLIGHSGEAKRTIGELFAATYPRLTEDFFSDREPEHTVLDLSVQILTVPSVATRLVAEQGFLGTIFDLLYSLFTDQFSDPVPALPRGRPRRRLVLPPDPTVTAVDLDGACVKQKRYAHLFNELGYLLNAPGVRSFVCSDPTSLYNIARFFDLFTNMNPTRRAVDAHVEFENDVWVSVFNLTIQLSRIARQVGECFDPSKAGTGAGDGDAMVLVGSGPSGGGVGEAKVVLMAATVVERIREKAGQLKTHKVTLGGTEKGKEVWHEVVAFKVESEPVSFHHPLNWLLAEMLRSVPVEREEAVARIWQAFAVAEPEIGPLKIGENVIRVLAMIAQVRAGLWVRNGFGLRAQHLHYRDAHLRENTFDQDLFFLQCLTCAVDDPSRLLVTLVDRFGLATWFADEGERTFELGQIVSLLEELLWLITVTVSEPSSVAGWPGAERLRREVVHVLCLGPLPFTEIEKRVPGRLTETEGSLDKVLKEVAELKLPAGTSDVGTYTLRPGHIAEVDPFFYRFSRNQREECDKLATAHVRKETGNPAAVRVPTPSSIKTGPFAGLNNVFTSEVFLQILFVCLARFHPQTKAYSENLADHAVHLVMLGLLERGRSFASLATTVKFTLEGRSSSQSHRMTLSAILQAMEREPAMTSLKPKVSWCLDQIGSALGMIRATPLAAAGDATKSSGAEDAKKAAAKARQAAIMKQMAAQQQQAMHNLSFEDDDEDDEDEAMEGGDGTQAVSHGQCIVCQDELHDGDEFGSLCYLQTSRFVRHTPAGIPPEKATEWLCEALEVPENLDFDCRLDGPFGVAGKRTPESDDVTEDSTPFAFPRHHARGLYASACGHLMHLSCFQVYYASVKQRHLTQVTRNHPENIERYEFLCPLCRSLGNVLLPHVKAARVSAIDPRPGDIRAWLTSQPSAAALASGDTVQFATTESTMEQWVFDELPTQKGATAAATSGVPKASATMLSRFVIVSQVLGSELIALRDDYDEEPAVPRRRQSVDSDVIAYTIACLEIASRGHLHSDGVASSVTDAQRRLLQALLGSLKAMLCMAAVSPHGPERAAAMLAQQFYVHEADMATRRPHLLADPLALLVQIAAVSPEAVPHAISVCYYLEVLRATFGLARLGAQYRHEWWRQARVPPASGAENVSEGQLWRNLVIRFFTIFSNPWQNAVASMDDLSFQRLLFAYTLPFLRRAAIVQHIVTGGARDLVRPLPQALEDASEHERLRFQLGIPPVSDVFAQSTDGSNDPLCTLMMRWLNHFHRYALGQGQPSTIYKTLPALEHPGIYELVGLPRSYNALVGETGTRRCPRCDTIPNKPALCLLCGALVCTQSYCCMNDNIASNPEHGECNMHMWSCGGSVAIYLSVTECALIYLATQNGALTPAPYLDEHGETSPTLKRSRPQYLHRPRWEEVRKLWLHQMIPTFVARKQDASTDVGGWPTL